MTIEVAPALADPKEKLIGEILANRYQIEMRLGEGAMGTVYKARHVKVGRAFAVKVLHAKLLEDGKVAQRFEREAELAGRLRHANVVGVVDVGETPDGLRYMVMDFAQGDDLAEMLSQAPMPAPRIINLTRQMLEGLYHAHEQGLIHRDFKPENVIVEKDMHGVEVPRIVDFGIAILREGGESPTAEGRLTTNGLVLGTPHYMAPEQAVADPIDHRIDLFALGIVVYEMLSGKLPFDGTGAEVARANLLLDPPVIAQRVPYLEVDPLLEAFARRMMAKKRDDRPATAKAARELLDLIERDRPAAAAALGVPLAIGTRQPQITEDVPPQRHAHEDSSSDQYDAQPDPTLPAPAPAAPRAVQHEIRTSVTSPLDYGDELPRSNTRKWVIAGIGLVAAGGLAAFLLGRGGDDTTPKPEDTKIVMEATPAEPVVTPITPENVADKVPVVAVDPDDVVTPDEVTPDEVTPDEVTPDEVTPDKVTPDKVTPDKGKRPIKTKVDPTQIKPPGTDDKVTTPEVKPEVTPPVTAPTASSVAAHWQKVGQQIRALGPGQDDLWNRYRRIQIQDAMKDPNKLREAADILAKLSRDLAKLKN
jgi:serine/threonine protein kinase